MGENLKCPSWESSVESKTVYNSCDCFRRNGLQDDCQRPECLSRLTKPLPTDKPLLYDTLFDDIPMGKSANTVGARKKVVSKKESE